MVSSVNSTGSIFVSPYTTGNNASQKAPNTSLNSFDKEDQAIISAEAKMLNELDKFNSGNGDAVDLAITNITSKNQIEAEVNVINTKKEMMDKVLEIGE